MLQFETLNDQVLVYRVQENEDICVAFFNPSYEVFQYAFAQEVNVLFDNGMANAKQVTSLRIEPHSVVVCSL